MGAFAEIPGYMSRISHHQLAHAPYYNGDAMYYEQRRHHVP